MLENLNMEKQSLFLYSSDHNLVHQVINKSHHVFTTITPAHTNHKPYKFTIFAPVTMATSTHRVNKLTTHENKPYTENHRVDFCIDFEMQLKK